MDPELQGHIIDIKSALSEQGATLRAVNDKLDYHINADESKFKDLYARHSEHDKFQARARGYTKGVTALAAVASAVAGAYAKAKGMF